MMVAAAVILLRLRSIHILCFTFSGIVGIGVASAVEREAPEPAGEHASQRLVKEGQDLIAVANGHAAVAGASVLRAGGSALDAAIAAQLVLNLVEPQSSGMGGGAFLLYFDSTSRELISYDGRETAPASAQPDMFLHSDGTAPTYLAALVGGNSVGAPGLLRMLSLAHKNHGRLSWARLFTPAIDIADSGFAISPRLHTLIAKVPTLNQFENTANYFFTPDGFPKAVGTKLTNESFAQTLRELAVGGAETFYRGPIAQDIAETVALAGVNPGGLTASDIADYRPFVRPPVCLDYRGFLVCGMGPPSSGGIAVLQILGLLSNFDLGSMKPWSADAAHLFLEASRLAFADRSRYVADPDFVRVPVNGLLDQKYLDRRAALINTLRANDVVGPGLPPGAQAGVLSDDDSIEFPSTTHISAFDRYGNVASMTSSIEFAFGSALMVRGFLLNNQLTDFSFSPERNGRLVANRVEPGKRPRSSMAPTVVFDPGGNPIMAIGSPGGSRIICYVSKALVGMLDWDLDLDDAIAFANLCNRNGVTELEVGDLAGDLKAALVRRGHEVVLREMNSGLHAIMVAGDDLVGAADPRREGAVRGH